MELLPVGNFLEDGKVPEIPLTQTGVSDGYNDGGHVAQKTKTHRNQPAFLDLEGRYRRADNLAGCPSMTCGMRGFEDDFCQHWPNIGSILSEIFVRGVLVFD